MSTALLSQYGAVSARVIAEMYADPFWDDRFAGRGRTHSSQDGQFHAQYLVEALRARDPGVLVHYAQWLRSVLTPRGMCSEHLADNLRLLGEAVLHDALPEAPVARRMLQQAADALRYRTGPEGILLEQADALMADVEQALGAPGVEALRHASLTATPRYQLSYLMDAIASRRPTPFVEHVRFLSSFLERRAPQAPSVQSLLTALVTAIYKRAPEAEAAASALVTPALHALSTALGGAA